MNKMNFQFLTSPFKATLGKVKFKLPTRGQAGFSLLEIIIVIALIGTLVGIIVNRLSGGADQAKVGITETKALTIFSKLLQYQLAHDGKFPTTDQGLKALMAGSGGVPLATEDDIKDGWNNPFDYKLTSKGPLIISMGKDGQPGTSSAICYLDRKKLDSCSNVDAGASN